MKATPLARQVASRYVTPRHVWQSPWQHLYFFDLLMSGAARRGVAWRAICIILATRCQCHPDDRPLHTHPGISCGGWAWSAWGGVAWRGVAWRGAA